MKFISKRSKKFNILNSKEKPLKTVKSDKTKHKFKQDKKSITAKP